MKNLRSPGRRRDSLPLSNPRKESLMTLSDKLLVGALIGFYVLICLVCL